MRQNISPSLQNAQQQKLDEWTTKLQSQADTKEHKLKARQEKEQEMKTYEEKRQKVTSLLKQYYEKGLSLREMSRITGISSATIGRWIKQLQEKEKQQHAEGQTS